MAYSQIHFIFNFTQLSLCERSNVGSSVEGSDLENSDFPVVIKHSVGSKHGHDPILIFLNIILSLQIHGSLRHARTQKILLTQTPLPDGPYC